MKKIITLIAISSLVLLTSCGETETPVDEIPVDEVLNVEEILDEAIWEEAPTDEGMLTDEEIDKELEEIFNID